MCLAGQKRTPICFPTLSPCKSKSTHPNYNLRPAIDVSWQELSIAGLKLNFG